MESFSTWITVLRLHIKDLYWLTHAITFSGRVIMVWLFSLFSPEISCIWGIIFYTSCWGQCWKSYDSAVKLNMSSEWCAFSVSVLCWVVKCPYLLIKLIFQLHFWKVSFNKIYSIIIGSCIVFLGLNNLIIRFNY